MTRRHRITGRLRFGTVARPVVARPNVSKSSLRSMARGNRRYWTTMTVMSTSLARMEASLTPRIGGESKNIKS